jgi:uncharacterized membrane protein
MPRWLRPDASALARLVVAGAAGVVVAAMATLVVSWQLALLCGWDAAALAFLGVVWPGIIHADGERTELLATREDLTRDTARLVLLAACTASLVAVGLAISEANTETGGERAALLVIAMLTVVLSWTVVNTVFLLRYAHLYYSAPPSGIEFGGAVASDRPDYGDFAYLAFTIGMCYQVSDTSLRDRRIRRTVLIHSMLSYIFGVVIVATGVNIVAGLG